MNWKLILVIALLGFGAYQHFSNRPVSHGPGVIASQQPTQTASNQQTFTHNGYTITPLEDFAIEARVLAAKDYTFGREAELAPVDLVLGWGSMSNETVLSKIDISQSNRFYYWHVDEFHIPREEIETQSANMHMIPADTQVERTLKSLRPGQVVKLTGYLIEAKASDGWHWKSSLTRNDTGNGACEVVYIKTLTIH